MIRIWILLTTLILSISAGAQTADDSVRAVVTKLFVGMKNSDAGMIRDAFADSAILQTISRTKDGKLFVRNENLEGFIHSISTLKKGAADERIEFGTVKTDGPLAIAWTPYKFYYDGNFSHCGVNSFQLVRINNAWKIQYLIDTRRKQPCE